MIADQLALAGSLAPDELPAALAVEDRREWERDLLTFHLEQLAQAGGEAPEAGGAWRRHQQNLMYPLHCWTCVDGAAPWMPEMQPEASRLLIDRVATAIGDLGALETF